MEKLRLLVLEDQVMVAADLVDMLNRLGHEIVACVDNGREALDEAAKQWPDLAILDVKVKGGMNGLEVGRRMRNELHIPIIYLTAMDEVYDLARETQPHDFLNKPVDPVRLKRSIELAVQHARQTSDIFKPPGIADGVVFIRHNDRRKRVDLKDVCYLRADGGYCHLHMIHDKITLARPMRTVLEELSRYDRQGRLIQVHRSHSINLDHVTDIRGNMLMVDGECFDIGETYRERVLNLFPTL